MATNRFASVRYNTLDRCLRNKNKHYSIYDLANACDKAIFKVDEKERDAVSIRQIRNDLIFMESEAGFQAEIDRYKQVGDKKTYFRYEDPDFSISQRPFTDWDLEQLRQAILILQRFEGLPMSDWIEEFSTRITELSDLNEHRKVAICFEKNAFLEAHKWISFLYEAIINDTPLRIEYKPFDKPLEIHLVSPYLVKQYNKRWFVLCKTDQVGYLTNMALDRIRKIEPGIHKYHPYPGDNAEEFFEDIIGVTNFLHEEVQKITIEIEKFLWPYIKTKPIHESQKIIKSTEDKDWVRIELGIKTNYEFYAVILSHGPRMRIVFPDSAREKLKGIINEMGKNY